MKELDRNTQIDIHNTKLLIHTPDVYLRHHADGRSLHDGRIATGGNWRDGVQFNAGMCKHKPGLILA